VYALRVGERERREHAEAALLDTLLDLTRLANPTASIRGERLARLLADLVEIDGSYDGEVLAEAAHLAQIETLAAESSRAREEVCKVLHRAPSLQRTATLLSVTADGGRCVRGGGRDAELFAVASEFDRMTNEQQIERGEAWRRLSDASPELPSHAVESIRRWVESREAQTVVHATIAQLADGMRLVDDIRTDDGVMLIARGQEVTPKLRSLLDSYTATNKLREPVAVLASAEQVDAMQALVLT
jgi:hypothetical protein